MNVHLSSEDVQDLTPVQIKEQIKASYDKLLHRLCDPYHEYLLQLVVVHSYTWEAAYELVLEKVKKDIEQAKSD